MYIYLNGKEYEVKWDKERQAERLAEMSGMDETVAFYIPINIDEVNEDDTVLFVNTKTREVFALYLSVLNSMLYQEIDPVLASFPEWSIIEGDYDNFIVCDARTIKAMIGVVTNERIGIVRSINHIAICPNINSEETFVFFSNVKSFVQANTKHA